MPVYDYKCAACGNREEHILLFSDPAPEKCAKCGGALKRAWGGGRVMISLEGWGFSRNDGLVSERGPRKDWKALKRKAEQIRDE